MTKVEETRKAIFEKYPDAVINFEYCDGEILFYPSKEQAENDENEDRLHGGYIKDGKLIDVTDF